MKSFYFFFFCFQMREIFTHELRNDRIFICSLSHSDNSFRCHLSPDFPLKISSSPRFTILLNLHQFETVFISTSINSSPRNSLPPRPPTFPYHLYPSLPLQISFPLGLDGTMRDSSSFLVFQQRHEILLA